MRKYIYILAIIAVILGVILFGIWLGREKGEPPVQQPQNRNGGGELPIGGVTNGGGEEPGGGQDGGDIPSNGSVGAVTPTAPEVRVLDYFVEADGGIVTIQPDGQVVHISGTDVTTLSSTLFPGILEVHFSHDGKKLLVLFDELPAPRVGILDLTSGTWTYLPTSARAIAWSPTNYEIVYIRGDNGALETLDVAQTSPKPTTYATLSFYDVRLEWLPGNRLIIWEKGSDSFPSSIWNFDFATRTLSPLTANISSFDALWDASGNTGLMFGANAHGGKSLVLVDTSGRLLHSFSFLTLPSKCGFVAAAAPDGTATATSTLYCAVPRETAFASQRLPDAYFKKDLLTTDDLYKINLDDGNVTGLLTDKRVFVDATLLKATEQALYFVNRYDQLLYSIPL